MSRQGNAGDQAGQETAKESERTFTAEEISEQQARLEAIRKKIAENKAAKLKVAQQKAKEEAVRKKAEREARIKLSEAKQKLKNATMIAEDTQKELARCNERALVDGSEEAKKRASEAQMAAKIKQWDLEEIKGEYSELEDEWKATQRSVARRNRPAKRPRENPSTQPSQPSQSSTSSESSARGDGREK